MPPWLADQAQWQRQQPRPQHAPSPLSGVSTQEVLEALGSIFSPTELDWELVGVTFVQESPDPATPRNSPVALIVDEPPWVAEAQAPSTGTTTNTGRIAQAFIPSKPRKWLPEHDEVLAAVRDLAWEGYRSMIADIFRREGYEVFEGEGPDRDVIDMEVVRGAERMLVNCQLRGLREIGVEPLLEMVQVADRNGADGAFIVSDGDFVSDAWSLAGGQALVLIDREALIGLVLGVTIGAGREKKLSTQVRRLFAGLQTGDHKRAS
jgi:hypothetical protein